MAQVKWVLQVGEDEVEVQAGVAWEEAMVIGVGMAMVGHMVDTTHTDMAIGAMDHMVVATDTEEWPGVRHLEVDSTAVLQGAGVLKEASGRNLTKGFFCKTAAAL